MSPFWGTFRVEFAMQARRPALWILSLAVSTLLLWDGRAPWHLSGHPSLGQEVGGWAFVVNSLTPLPFGLLLADRVVRDRRARVWEVLRTAPAFQGARTVAKYLGVVAAGILPILLVYACGLVYIAIARDGGAAPLALGPAAFGVINLPGLLFVAAFALMCPLIMPVPIFQILYTGYWFWGNALDPHVGIPTLSATELTPVGSYAALAFFHTGRMIVTHASAPQALLSIGLLLTGAALALWGGHRVLQART